MSINNISQPQWPPRQPEIVENFAGTGLAIYREMYGALSQDPNSPFSRIAVANSSFSLDPVVGCPAGCRYCLVASSARDLGRPSGHPIGASLIPTKPRTIFPGGELVRALVKHPAFIPNESVISVGSGSTEAFLPVADEETWSIINALIECRLTNPIWIITKLGICDDHLPRWLDRFRTMLDAGIRLVLSVTYSAAPSSIEPVRGDRFRHIDKLRNVGVRVSHHLRPIIRGLNDDYVTVWKALAASDGIAEVICYGGLRPDPGIKLAWQHVYHLDPALLPTGTEKDLPQQIHDTVRDILRQLGSDVPAVARSSEAISLLLNIPDYNLYRYRPDDKAVFLRVPYRLQRQLQQATGTTLAESIERAAATLQMPAVGAVTRGTDVFLSRPLTYQEHRVLIHRIGHSRLLP